MNRREILRSYLLEVARDLAIKGTINRRNGESLVSLLNREMPAVLRSVHEDLVSVGGEMAKGLAQGLITAGVRWLSGGQR